MDDQMTQSGDIEDGVAGCGDPVRREADRQPARFSGGVYGIAAALAALAGFAAVYVSLQGRGNDPAAMVNIAPDAIETRAVDTTSNAVPTPEPEVAGIATNPAIALKAFAKGSMVTFVAKNEPAEVNPFTFRQFASGDDGVEKTLADWKGKVVLLNMWATWCAPCRKEMPELVKLKEKLGGDNFDLIAVSIDRGGPEKPRKFLSQINAQSLGVFQSPSSKIAGPLKAFGMPTTILFDREGRELGRLVGPADWASDDARALIEAAIAATG